MVLFPNSGGGLPPEEITIAELLKQQGYATGCVGKWHLGHLPQFLPTEQGFDSYYGIPYSNDMHRPGGVPLMQGTEVIERPVDQTTVTKRYTEQATQFIREHRERPFFLFLSHTMPHIPLFVSDDYKDQSPRGLYGDVVEEIDGSVGAVLASLRACGCDKNTLVVFTSDNGPWLSHKLNGGSAGLLRAGKGTTFEGGMRVPTIFWWPEKIEGGSVVTQMGSTLDLLATTASLAGATLPTDRTLDSLDLSTALFGQGESPRDHMFYYTRGVLYAVRKGPYKLHLWTRQPIRYGRPPIKQDPPLLYHLGHDPGELYDIADKNPKIVQELMDLIAQHAAKVETVPDQFGDPTAQVVIAATGMGSSGDPPHDSLF